jgi:hypothetical protein
MCFIYQVCHHANGGFSCSKPLYCVKHTPSSTECLPTAFHTALNPIRHICLYPTLRLLGTTQYQSLRGTSQLLAVNLLNFVQYMKAYFYKTHCLP